MNNYDIVKYIYLDKDSNGGEDAFVSDNLEKRFSFLEICIKVKIDSQTGNVSAEVIDND